MLTAADAVRVATETLREMRDEFRAKGDVLAARIADRCLVRVARRLAGRTDEGRREDNEPGEPTP